MKFHERGNRFKGRRIRRVYNKFYKNAKWLSENSLSIQQLRGKQITNISELPDNLKKSDDKIAKMEKSYKELGRLIYGYLDDRFLLRETRD